MRMMAVFEKSYPLRHIGHLDLMRTMQRALRRSGLPVRYSQGFNPHIRLSFAAPLGVGVAGEREIMDVAMESECGAEMFIYALNRVINNCLKIVAVRAIDDSFPSLMGLVAGSRYRIEMDTKPEAYADAVGKLLALDEYKALRKTKSGEKMSNIRPYLEALEISDSSIIFTARNLPSGALKPEILMNVLFSLSDLPPCGYAATREAILAKDAQGRFVPLEAISDE